MIRADLAACLLLALALRLWGLDWGLPERPELHPDEAYHVMNHALALSLDDPDPKFVNYPSLLMYTIAVANAAGKAIGVIEERWQSFLLGRLIVAGFGTATVAAAFWLAEAVGTGPWGPGLAALWVAILPLHVWESHVAVTDVVMTFWILIVLVAASRLVEGERRADAILAGAALGLAVASKYTAALAATAPLMAVLLSPRSWLARAKTLALIAAVAVVACVVTTPYSFYHFGALLEAIKFENRHVHGHQAGFSLPAAGPQYRPYVYQLVAAFPFSLGFVLYASAAAGTIWAAARVTRPRLVVLGFGALFFVVTGSWAFTPLRYYLPLVALGAILAGAWQGTWLASESRPRRWIAAAAVVVTLVYTSLFTLQTTERFSNDTRLQAERWLVETLPPQGKLLLAGWSPYMATVPSPPYAIEGRNETVVGHPDYLVEHDLVEISSLHYLRAYRDGHPALLRAYENLRRGRLPLRLVRRFKSRFLNRRLYRRLDPMFEAYFVSPTLEFYAPVPDGARSR